MNHNSLKQRIILSVLITIFLIVINPSDGDGLEINRENLCNRFSDNYSCKNIQLNRITSYSIQDTHTFSSGK